MSKEKNDVMIFFVVIAMAFLILAIAVFVGISPMLFFNNDSTKAPEKAITPDPIKVPLVLEVEPLNIVVNVTANVKTEDPPPVSLRIQAEPSQNKPLQVKVEAVSDFRTMLIPIRLDVKDKYGELIPPPKDEKPKK